MLSRSFRLFLLLPLGLAALLTLIAPAAARAQAVDTSTSSTLVVNTDATFMRAAPDVRAPVVTRLERGDRVEVLERPGGDWWRVRAGDPPREGYVHRLVLGPATAPAPARQLPRSVPPVAAPPDDPQTDDATRTPARGLRPGIGVVASGGVGLLSPTARDTFDAVGITGNPMAYTGSVEVVRLFRSLFVRGSFDVSSETGERVFLTESGERFPLGIPLDIEMQPLEATVGWRFEPRARRARAVVPYVGGGAGSLRYRESDPFAEGDENVDERFTSYHVLAGADVFVHRWLGIRAEYRFRHVPDALGAGGVSALTGDTSLGGSLFFVGVAIGR